MRKYLFPVVGLLCLSMLVPANVSAKASDDTKVDLYYYQSPSYNDGKLSAADMAEAQTISAGATVSVDFSVDDYKVYKLNVAANQVVTIERAKNGNNQGTPTIEYYDANGTEVYPFSNGVIGSEKAESYYMLVYSNAPVVSSFTVKSMMFSDNVTQKTDDGYAFGFIPTVTGTYSFNVKDSSYKDVRMYISGETKDYQETEGKYTYTVSATLTAGKFYKLCLDTDGKYTLTLTKSAAADAVANQISAIGAATTANGSAIDAARAAYNALSPAEQKVVSNASTLTALESQYANLTKPSVAKVKIKKVKAAKKGKKVTVTWKKVSGAAGYQVTYSLKKKFKNAKTVTVSASKAKTVLKKLKKNKKYYVKVRAFKTYRGQTYYGSYSKVKKVTVN